AILVCLLLTRSRGSWLGLAAGLAALAALRYRRLAIPLAGGAALLAGLAPAGLSPAAHLLTGFQAGDRATQMRFGEYKDALILIGQYPWLGVGFGNAPSLDLYVGVSSAYLLLAEQAGLLRLAAYQPAGIATYARELLGALARVADPAEWRFVALRSRRDRARYGCAGRVRDHPLLTPPHHRFEQSTLPLELAPLGIDLLHSP